MFDLRTEAEMRLHSEKTAAELARQRRREEAPADRQPSTEREPAVDADVADGGP
ncbi:hypothetical protein ABZ848_24295 [Streptomyces sp. NPDC047081]|uniref:hypothetical protein n=1 Tax=Streptomyces sp. NPDC047081 TaxID=3154706 RepID=UPI0033F1FCE9